MTKRKPSKPATKSARPLKIGKSSLNGSVNTSVLKDDLSDELEIHEAVDELTFLIVGLMKGCNSIIDEEEAYEYIGLRLLEGMTYEEAMEAGALLARTTPAERRNEH